VKVSCQSYITHGMDANCVGGGKQKSNNDMSEVYTSEQTFVQMIKFDSVCQC
jgi:hypothetical protein